MTTHGRAARSRMIDDVLIDFMRPAGYRDVLDVVRAHDAGEPLPPDALGRLVDALRVFLAAGDADKQLRDFGKRARILGKQGRREPTADEADDRIRMVAALIERERKHVAAGMPTRSAAAQAKREIAAEWHASLRKVQDAARAFDAEARQLLVVIEHARNRVRADKS